MFAHETQGEEEEDGLTVVETLDHALSRLV